MNTNSEVQNALKLLGMKTRDKVTGFVGVVEHVGFDLYGCIQATVRPEVKKSAPTEIADCKWFDVKRLTTIGSKPVMEQPSFAVVGGPAEKPSRPSFPAR